MTTINLAIGPLVALIAGVLILIIPRLLNYIVAIYLIVIGLVGIFGWGDTRIRATAIDNSTPVVSATVADVARGGFATGVRVIDTGS